MRRSYLVVQTMFLFSLENTHANRNKYENQILQIENYFVMRNK